MPIIEHADVRRMLLEGKANAEGAMALILECAMLVDHEHTAPTEDERLVASQLLEVLTPLAKTFPALGCQVTISNAMQVMGGYGCAREYPIEQHFRDNRLNQIHEGTHGIQALAARIKASIAEAASPDEGIKALSGQLGAALGQWAECTQLLGVAMATDPTRALANATVYYEVSARVVVAWLWLRMAVTAECRRSMVDGSELRDFYSGKLAAAHYWFGWELPRIGPDIALLNRLDDVPYSTAPEWLQAGGP